MILLVSQQEVGSVLPQASHIVSASSCTDARVEGRKGEFFSISYFRSRGLHLSVTGVNYPEE